jgi:hypothetical protein
VTADAQQRLEHVVSRLERRADLSPSRRYSGEKAGEGGETFPNVVSQPVAKKLSPEAIPRGRCNLSSSTSDPSPRPSPRSTGEREQGDGA